MRRLTFFVVTGLFFASFLYGKTTLRIVIFSSSVTKGVVERVYREVTAATITGIPEEPRGVPQLEKIYGEIQKSFVNLDYPSVIKRGEEAIGIIQENLKNVKDWKKVATILKLGAIAAFATRSFSRVDKFLYNMVKYFPQQELQGKAIPPDLYLRWKVIKRKTIFVEVNFNSPVSDVTIKVDGRVIEGEKVKLPQGVHQIVWETPYEKGVKVVHIYAKTSIDIPLFPVDIGSIRKVVLKEGWCSGELKDLFELKEIETPVLFINDTSPHYVLIDPSLKETVLEGDNIFTQLNEILSRYSELGYIPPAYCTWGIPFYKKWWFYLGIGIVAGGGFSAYEINNYINNHNTVTINW